jgi:tRNA/tmRNA/rRNA uracil-C5-methylase (TrmA/RlmC/RlmD family)
VRLDEQRRLKAAVVEEQLARLAGDTRHVVVEPAPDDDGLHWRTRLRLATDERGRAGFRRHRSHQIEPIDDCLIAASGAKVSELLARTWPADSDLTVDVSATGERAVAVGVPPDTVTERAAGREWSVPVGGFWQVHVAAAELLAATVVQLAAPRRNDRCLDLYSGVGLFAGALGSSVTEVTAVVSDRRAAAAARHNLADLPVRVVRERVDAWVQQPRRADLVVLDPPRKGAGREVVSRIAGFGARRLLYVACDPSALARDAAVLRDHGYELTELRAFDLFPMTAHVECVAAFDAVGRTEPR